jgi:hypothetical protein
MEKAGFAVLFAFMFLYSCKQQPASEQSEESEQTEAVTDTTPLNEAANYKFSYTIANLPSPVEALEEFQKSGFETDVTLLNDPDKADKYHTGVKQAFNYGIYGVDLAYAVVNDRAPEIIKYYSAAKKLAEKLNLGETFSRFVSRLEQNAENKDSLKQVVDEAYSATDKYLRSNERLATASQILAGSWLECQYITVNLLKDVERTPENASLYQRVWEQRLYLDNITGIFNELNGDKELEKIKADLDALVVIYKEPTSADSIDKDFLVRLSNNLKRVRENIVK